MRCSVFLVVAAAVFSPLDEELLGRSSSSSSSSALFFVGVLVAVLLVVDVFLLAFVEELDALEEVVDVVVDRVVLAADDGVDVLVAGSGVAVREGAEG